MQSLERSPANQFAAMPANPITAAQQHYEAAKKLGHDIAADFRVDVAALAAGAETIAAMKDIIVPGVCEEARQIAASLNDAAQRMARLLGST